MNKEDFYILQLQKFIQILKKLIDPNPAWETIRTDIEQIQLHGDLLMNYFQEDDIRPEVLSYISTLNLDLFKALLDMQYQITLHETSKRTIHLKKLNILHNIYSKTHHLFDLKIQKELEKL